MRDKDRDALSYEMWMLRKTHEAVSQNAKERHVACAVLESFLIHARNLIRFFYPAAANDRHEDDLVADDFFSDRGRKWVAKHRRMPERLRDELDAINTAVSHLSGVRPHKRKEWDEDWLLAELEQLFSEFNGLGPVGGPVEALHPDLQRGRDEGE